MAVVYSSSFHSSTMARTLTPVHLSLVLLCMQDDECAHLNNTTFQEYQQRHRLQVQYLLLTRGNPDCPRLFSPDTSTNDRQQPSLFNCSRPTKIIVHGYRALGSRPSWVKDLARALLRAEDSNVLVVDWVYGASFAYNLVVDIYKEVAMQMSGLINQLQNQGCTLESFHLIGVSLGAHVAGFVGLDPAGPMFKRADLFNRLDPSDALFVEAIHTDSDYFGISIPVGHVDFFLNGGMDQAGCVRSSFTSVLVYFPVYGYVICDHMRALYVYISALNGLCALSGFPCASYEEYLQGRCLSCQGPCPTIARHVLLDIRVSQLEKTAELEVTLMKDSMATKHKPEEALCVNNIDVYRGTPWSHDYVQVCDDY
ncbi:hypothetical protein CRUP_014133 [Coryphaenoides rupestris]|nr:hypothetical protein CRUP_014133 [Coryphaenoides rupestris]